MIRPSFYMGLKNYLSPKVENMTGGVWRSAGKNTTQAKVRKKRMEINAYWEAP